MERLQQPDGTHEFQHNQNTLFPVHMYGPKQVHTRTYYHNKLTCGVLFAFFFFEGKLIYDETTAYLQKYYRCD